MSIQIKGFVTRSDAGLRAPRSVSHNITPQHGGCAPHYGGPTQPAANPGSDHSVCVKTWRAWQNFHMDTHGWVDIAYTGGFCNHGYAFAGRGFGVRTAANGTDSGNQSYYAFVWIGGEGQQPSKEAFDACDWWINEARTKGAGNAVRPHRWFKLTGCPGDPFVQYAADRHLKPIPEGPSKPAVGIDLVVADLQGLIHTEKDGLWGPTTDLGLRKMRTAAISKSGQPSTNEAFDVRFVQEHIGAKVDGVWGPASAASLVWWIRLFQKVLAQPNTGRWDADTERAFQAVRNAHLNQY